MTTASGGPPPRLLEILLTWFSIGIQSFGGGSTTLYLIRQACVTRGWLTEAEFAKDWALVQISPGVNLIKITAVIGHQLRGWPGLLAAICGLLLPSATDHRADDGRLRHHPGLAVRQGGDPRRDPRHHRHQRRAGHPDGAGAVEPCAPRGAASGGCTIDAAGRLALLLAVAHASPVIVLALAGISGMLLLGDLVAAIRRAAGVRWAGSLDGPDDPIAPIGPLLYFWLFLKASLLSTGGLGNLPFLHQDLIALGWATEADFLVAMAVGQVSPGPNGLWTISLGYLTYGWLGAGLSLIAITLPTLLALVVVALHRRVETHPLVQRFTLGVTLGVIGLTLGVA